MDDSTPVTPMPLWRPLAHLALGHHCSAQGSQVGKTINECFPQQPAQQLLVL